MGFGGEADRTASRASHSRRRAYRLGFEASFQPAFCTESQSVFPRANAWVGRLRGCAQRKMARAHGFRDCSKAEPDPESLPLHPASTHAAFSAREARWHSAAF